MHAQGVYLGARASMVSKTDDPTCGIQASGELQLRISLT